MSLVRPITRGDIKGPAMYAHIRDDYRRRVIELKKARRVFLGDRVEIVFDNRLTLTMQIEEIYRLENLSDAQLEAELETTNQLMPNEDTLAATMFVPLPQDEHIKERLRELVGLDEHVILHLGPHALRAQSEPGRSTEDKISAVQYLRFALTAELKALLRTEGTTLELELDHPSYLHRVVCDDALRASLAGDYA